jgi:hypothetical protein
MPFYLSNKFLLKHVIDYSGYFNIENVFLCILSVTTEFYQEVQEDTHKGIRYLQPVFHYRPSLHVSGADSDCHETHSSADPKHMKNAYVAAEYFGRGGGDCLSRYAACSRSPLDLISTRIENQELLYEEERISTT